MIEQINAIAEGWLNWMWPMFWQVSVLVIFVGAVDLLLRKRVWPQVRYALWLLILVKLILPPTFSLSTSVVSQVRTQAHRTIARLERAEPFPDVSPSEPALKTAPLILNTDTRPAASRGNRPDLEAAGTTEQTLSSHAVVGESGGHVRLSWKAYSMFFWLTGVIVLLFWAVARFRRLRRIHSPRHHQADHPQWLEPLMEETARRLHLRKLPAIVLSEYIPSPAVFGTFRPVLVLPAAVRRFSHKHTEHILLHELAHIKRGDLMVNTLYTLLQIVYWFNPLLWLVRRRLQHLRELCCDATVARILREKTTDYRDTILETAKRFLPKPVEPGIGLLGLFETSSRLLVRLKWLEKNTWKHRGLRIGTACAVVALMMACILPMAKAKATKQASIRSENPGRTDQSSEPGGEWINPVTGFVTDKMGRSRGNVYITTSLNKIRDAVRTDEKGRFTLEGLRSEQRHWMAYSHASRAIGLFTIPHDYAGRPIHVVLNFGVAVAEGRIVGPDGKGLANRRVELVIHTKSGAAYSSECYRKTDEYGNYSSSIPSGSNLTCQVRLADADEAEKKYVTGAIPLTDSQIFYPMPKLVIGEGQPEETDDGKMLYRGRVLNEQDQPISGVKVELSYRMPKQMSMMVQSVMTNTDGRWQRRLPRDLSDLNIGLLHPEYIRQSWQRVSSAELHNGTNVLVMKRGLTLEGTVMDQQGKPVENALVDTGGGAGTTVFGEVIENCTTPRTLADGSFRVGGLAGESMEIVVSAAGYAPQIVPVDMAEGMKPIEVALKSGRTYTGQVVDVDGHPVEGVKINVRRWEVNRRWKSLTRIAETDSEGHFTIENLPEEGKLSFSFGKRNSGLMGFDKEIPEDVSGTDKIVIYKVPVFVGKVIDAETEEPITNFTLTNAIHSSAFGDEISWSRYRHSEMTSQDGTFSRTWGGYVITYPFDGTCELRVSAKGYLPEMAPPIRLGQAYEPCVVRLTKAEPLKGIVVDAEGHPADKAEVGWVGPKRIAFIKNGRFDTTGFSYQAEPIVGTDSNGRFELPPSRDEGLIVALHEAGYGSVSSKDLADDSRVRLTPWAKIEGSVVSPDKDGEEFVLSISPASISEESESRTIRWMFDRTSFSGQSFTIDCVPSIPLHIGRVVQSNQYDPVYVHPQPGETYEIKFGGKGVSAAGKRLASLVGKALPDFTGIQIDFNADRHTGKKILVCFWDMNQRPSRNCITQLAGQAEQFQQKGVVLVAVHAARIDQNSVERWTREHAISFPVGIVRIDEEKIRSAWGIESLPWLILTDTNHNVRAEGLSLSELDENDRVIRINKRIPGRQERSQGIELTGRVLTEDGQPVAGATVSLGNTYVTGSDEGYRDRESLSWQNGLFHPAHLQSESDGRFVFNFLLPGTTDVWAEHPKWGWAWVREIETDSKEIELRLRRQPQKIRLSGQALNPDQKPSKDARILIYIKGDDSLMAQTESDAEGRFKIDVDPPWTHFRQLILLCIPESGPPAWRIMPYCSADNLKIQLKQQASITGRVVNAKGEGVADATVRFYNAKDRDYGIAWFSHDLADASPLVQSDAEGNFTIGRIPLDSFVTLQVEHSEYGTEREWDIEANGEEIEIGDIQLPEGVTVEGTVRFAGTNEAAGGMKVTVDRLGKTLSQATTDRNGKYRLGGIALPGFYEILRIRAEGPGDTPEWEGQAAVEKELKPGDYLTDVDIHLERPLAYRQKIWRSRRGEVVEGCRIALLNDSDRAYKGKEVYEDTVTLYDSRGEEQWQITGLNTSQTVGANHAIVYNPYDKSIWCTEFVGERLIKLGLDGKVVFEKKDMEPHTLAVDPKTGNVWVLTSEETIYGKNLVVLDPSGQTIHDWNHKGFDLAYSEKEDCFWVVGKTVLKLNKDGEVLFEWPEQFAWIAVSVSINNTDGSAWVIERRHSQVEDSRNRVWVFEPKGQVRRQIDLQDRGVSGAAVDSEHGVAWVTTSQGILKLGLGGEIEADIPIQGFSVCVEPDTGYIWISGRDGLLYRLNRNGDLVSRTEAPGNSQKWLCAIPR